MLNIVSLLAAASLASLQCGLAAHVAAIDSSAQLDNSIQPNVIQSSRRQVKKYVRISLAPPETVELDAGQRLQLECQVYGSPSPSVTWLRNGKTVSDLEEDANEILSPHPSSIAQLTSKLVVPLPANADVYTCVATAGEKQQTASTTVYLLVDEYADVVTLEKILRKPSKPVITATYNDVIQEIGTSLLLPCRIHSYTKTQVEWADNHNNLVYGNSRFRVLPSGDLLIMGLRWSDMGNFSCSVKNAFGKDLAVTFVYPSKP